MKINDFEIRFANVNGTGSASNKYAVRRRSLWIYFSETVFAATGGAELEKGEGPGRIYMVEATGPFMDDPNVTEAP